MDELAPDYESEDDLSDFAILAKHQGIKGQTFSEDKEFILSQGDRITIIDCKFYGITTFHFHGAATLQLHDSTFYHDVSIESEDSLENSHIKQNGNAILSNCNFFGRFVCLDMKLLQLDGSIFRRDVSIKAPIWNSDIEKPENWLLMNSSRFMGHVEVITR